MNNSFNACEVKLTYSNKVKAADRVKIRMSKDTYDFLQKVYDPNTMDHHESFKVLLLNRAGEVLGVYSISEGGITGTIVDIRLIMQSAILANASAIILSHNHPSGNLCSSIEDNDMTLRIKKACEVMGISLLDHLILTTAGYYSYADEGMI